MARPKPVAIRTRTSPAPNGSRSNPAACVQKAEGFEPFRRHHRDYEKESGLSPGSFFRRNGPRGPRDGMGDSGPIVSRPEGPRCKSWLRYQKTKGNRVVAVPLFFIRIRRHPLLPLLLPPMPCISPFRRVHCRPHSRLGDSCRWRSGSGK